MATQQEYLSNTQIPFPSYHDEADDDDGALYSHEEAQATPRFSHLLTSVLGSPFLTTSDLPGDADTAYAPSIPLDRMDDDAGLDMETVDGAFASVPRSFTITRPTSPTPSFRTDTFSIVNWNPEMYNLMLPGNGDGTPRCSFLQTGRRTISGYPSSHWSPTPSPTKVSRSLTIGMGFLPKIWDALREGSPSKRGRRRPAIPSWQDPELEYYSDGLIDYANMMPLDGEEGELIDDEACFIDVRAITGIDIVSHLPLELALYLLSFLDLPSILACLRVSRNWNHLARDNSIWRTLFSLREDDGWCVDLRRAHRENSSSLRMPLSMMPAPLELNWYHLYRNRQELDRRWSNYPGAGLSADLSDEAVAEQKEVTKAWEPKVMRISGHGDSVYCLEFDSSRIITGSRDRTIKVWSLKTGKCLATFAGHRGSVLCLKFDRDWDILDDGSMDMDDNVPRKGFMVSGSSDCTVCVWDLWAIPTWGGEPRITAEVRAVLPAHSGGVLDLRIDSRWIVSCSKDALIRVWDRETLSLHCTLRGHEGPVNAVGLQGNRVVSASGDGKMILWDVVTGARLRTFEGHDRGLACIEFKEDVIVSGSNDCKIKVWDANTGACLRTLTGHDFLVRALSFDPRSGRLVSGSYDKTVKVWDLRSGKMVREFRGCHASHIFDVKFDHCRIVSTSHDRKIVVLDFSEGLDTSLFV
ncbi:WD40 repeat-like protein [Lentinus tigrinus ALCF2SS1-7]|uniref:WD40 repeat-like protein n=1 Tax=Lentinus tigrinus ALCF2SS1-6 TaxID=1328759 RepID=A0A5C2SDB4_9APHY|nr:WD40 repeat-like protein [Lentinus tigrinus ALCF2SS1-6]RPD76078.1 WD40 repeat-like protein [Lentinus tigrinus ALCF2SS1-7]